MVQNRSGIEVFEIIDYNFLITGHRFMSCDQEFAIIEKRVRVIKATVPNRVKTSAK